ncbi:hypothetical protein HKX69_30045 [Streptomyces argyrophyllae]|uniref:DUF3987 domain-containing protein n=1 Tax=Streptomyces argyrophylli TaxID=2726118 RepID=A0A6M4PQI0_9ACTN|nr:hypothetical protein [Streptomyces argyrophyllae]QJS13221.1 hypothetical protein HKX69_30045 [Streptomyces argyrophyllae]
MTAEHPPLTADPETVRTWLTRLYADSPGFLSTCSDADRFAGRRFTTDAKGISAATDYVLQLDRRRPKGIYAQVTTLRDKPTEGRGGEDLTYGLTHLWADGDFGTIGHKPGPDDLPAPPNPEAVEKVVSESGLPTPSGWAHTGGGYNPVWLLAEVHLLDTDETRAAAKQMTTGLQSILAAQAYQCGWSWDSEVGNLDRLMKIPGTVNRKEGLERVTAIGPGHGEVFDLADLRAVIADLAPDARTVLEQAAREKQQRKAKRTGVALPPPRRDRAPRERSGDGPLDVLADLLEFRDVLEPTGFTYVGQSSDGRQKWLRPTSGGDAPSSAYSLLCDDHVAVNWSERSDLPVGAQPPGQKLTVGTLYAHLHYAGNTSEAARDIMRAAADKPARGHAGRLPVAVLTEVKRRCLKDDEGARASFADDPWDGPQDEPPEDTDETPGTPSDRLPDSLWNTTPTMRQIRQMAQARRAQPDAVLHAVLARTAAMADPTVRVDSGIHQPATLGWYCGLFGPSGAGKGQAENTAEELTPFPNINLAYIDISTGQGIIAAYLDLEVDPEDGDAKKKVLVQTRTRGYALATEGSVLDAMAQMSAAATLNGVLCKAWMSERQGTSNAEVERRRVLPKGAYTLSMSLGVQEEPAAKLLEMGSIGLPQRLAWAHATLGPDTPKKRPATTGPITVTARDGSETPVTTWVAYLRNVTIPVPEHVTEELDGLALDISFGRGADAPLDTHEPLWRLKCAALLALLHGRTAVTDQDWEMARVMWQTSRSVRDRVQEAAQRRTQAERDAVRAEAVKTAAQSHAAVYELEKGVHPSVVNVAKRARRYLLRHGGEIPMRDVNRNCIKKPDRDQYRASGATDSLWSAALAYGSEQGWLAALEGGLLEAGPTDPQES